jgi:transposase-like protein
LLLDDSSLPVPSSLSTSRVVRVFPHEQSLLRLIAALPMDTNQGWMGRVYLRMEEEPEAATEAIAAAA